MGAPLSAHAGARDAARPVAHFRRAQREFGAHQARELRMVLGDALSNQPLEVIEGRKVIEVRFRGVSKALVAHRVLAEAVGDCFITAIGDDRTDEDLFRALPSSSATVVVGHRPSCARFRVADHREVRRILRALVTGAEVRNPTALEAVSAYGAGNRDVCLAGSDDSKRSER